MNVTWLVQSTLINQSVFDGINEACHFVGVGCQPIEVLPFAESIPDLLIPDGNKVVPYGSTSLIKNYAKSEYDKSGYFFNKENLRTSTWVKNLGDMVLNHGAVITTLRHVSLEPDAYYFIKPNDDLKDFTGDVIKGSSINEFISRVSAGGYLFDDNIEVVIAPARNTGWEFRLFMIDDRVITGSSYKIKSSLNKNKKVPAGVAAFAESVAKIWHPDDVFVMDICESDDGLKVVEFNCFNASGFYNCDVRAIVSEVSSFISQHA